MPNTKTPNTVNLLTEGYDSEKVAAQEEREEESVFETIQAAYQTDKVLEAELDGFERIDIDGSGKKTLCGIVYLDNKVKGIIPVIESGIDPDDPGLSRKFNSLMGKKISFKVLNYSKADNVFAGSRKKALEEMTEITLRKVDKDDDVICSVRTVGRDYLIGNVGGIDVRIPVSELTYEWIDDLRERYQYGDQIKVKVVEIDKEKKLLTVSKKPLLENPFDAFINRIAVNGQYVGSVTGVQDYGVFIHLNVGLDVLAQHFKYQKVEKGDRMKVRILRIDTAKKQIFGRMVNPIH